MFLFQLETYTSRLRQIGFAALLIAVAAWISDLAGAVYVCPFCRTQRTVIGLLGIVLMLPNPQHWIARYFASVVAFLGAVVASMQHFSGWRRISAGDFAFNERIYIDPFLLSGCALFIIIGLTWLIMLPEQQLDRDEEMDQLGA